MRRFDHHRSPPASTGDMTDIVAGRPPDSKSLNQAAGKPF